MRGSCPEPGRACRWSDQGRRGAGEAVVARTATGSARPPQDQPVGLQVQMQAVPMARQVAKIGLELMNRDTLQMHNKEDIRQPLDNPQCPTIKQLLIHAD